jgi:hypothetical protein
MPYKYDDRRSPIIIVTMSAEPRQPGEFARHLARMRAFALERRVAFIVDQRGCLPPTATERQEIADFAVEMARDHHGQIVCIAHLVATALQAGVITAIKWLQRPTTTTKVFVDMTASMIWCQNNLDAALRPAATPAQTIKHVFHGPSKR